MFARDRQSDLLRKGLTSALQRTAAPLSRSAALDFTSRLPLADSFRQPRSLSVGVRLFAERRVICQENSGVWRKQYI